MKGKVILNPNAIQVKVEKRSDLVKLAKKFNSEIIEDTADGKFDFVFAFGIAFFTNKEK